MLNWKKWDGKSDVGSQDAPVFACIFANSVTSSGKPSKQILFCYQTWCKKGRWHIQDLRGRSEYLDFIFCDDDEFQIFSRKRGDEIFYLCPTLPNGKPFSMQILRVGSGGSMFRFVGYEDEEGWVYRKGAYAEKVKEDE